ncbi:MAG: non-heme iron oxygenase ferredoxin subunit [Pseudomonadota bacterium]
MTWTPVAADDELGVGQMKRIAPAGKPLLLVKAEAGYFCVDEFCSHEDFSLWFGCVKGNAIKCSLHGSYFDLASGQPLNEPADCPLRTHPTRLEAGQVLVETT